MLANSGTLDVGTVEKLWVLASLITRRHRRQSASGPVLWQLRADAARAVEVGCGVDRACHRI